SLGSPDANALLNDALARRPDLKAARFQLQRAEVSVSAARRALAPDLALSANFTAEGTGQSAIQPPTLSFGLSAPFPLFYQYQGEIRRAEADRRTQALSQEKTEAQVANDVETAFVTYTNTRDRVQRQESRLLDRAKRTRDLILFQYQKGSASLLEY